MKRRTVFIPLLSVFIFLIFNTGISAQQTNFTVSPPPVAWPYFEDGRSDFAAAGSYISMKTDSVTLKGGAA